MCSCMERNRFSCNHDTLVSTLAYSMKQGSNSRESLPQDSACDNWCHLDSSEGRQPAATLERQRMSFGLGSIWAAWPQEVGRKFQDTGYLHKMTARKAQVSVDGKLLKADKR